MFWYMRRVHAGMVWDMVGSNRLLVNPYTYVPCISPQYFALCFILVSLIVIYTHLYAQIKTSTNLFKRLIADFISKNQQTQ